MTPQNDNEEITKLKQELETMRKTEVRRKIVEEGLKLLNTHKYTLSSDPEDRQNLLDLLRDKLEDDDTKIILDGDELTVVNANGTLKENDLGNFVSFSGLLKGTASRFFQKIQPGDKRHSSFTTAKSA